MLIIPAIDLIEGRCVRLKEGRKEDVTVYSDNPSKTAKRWESLGATLIHIVDLDGAFSGSLKNLKSIMAIREAVSVELELGGGIRDLETIRRLINLGINRVILGTSAVEDGGLLKEACRLYPNKIIVGIDAKNGMVAVKGWVESTLVRAMNLAKKIQSYGVGGIIYTDILRDGILRGANISAIKEMVQTVQKIQVIASGGVSSLNDIKKLAEINGLWGVIVGKALYEGRLNLKTAIMVAEGK